MRWVILELLQKDYRNYLQHSRKAIYERNGKTSSYNSIFCYYLIGKGKRLLADQILGEVKQTFQNIHLKATLINQAHKLLIAEDKKIIDLICCKSGKNIIPHDARFNSQQPHSATCLLFTGVFGQRPRCKCKHYNILWRHRLVQDQKGSFFIRDVFYHHFCSICMLK